MDSLKVNCQFKQPNYFYLRKQRKKKTKIEIIADTPNPEAIDLPSLSPHHTPKPPPNFQNLDYQPMSVTTSPTPQNFGQLPSTNEQPATSTNSKHAGAIPETRQQNRHQKYTKIGLAADKAEIRARLSKDAILILIKESDMWQGEQLSKLTPVERTYPTTDHYCIALIEAIRFLKRETKNHFPTRGTHAN